MKNQWQNRRVAFLGDSITDKIHCGTAKNYWQFLAETLEIEPLVYGLNGWQWNGVKTQAETLLKEQGTNVDAILIFMGTNDFNGSVPPGEWYTVRREEVYSRGQTLRLPRRSFLFDEKTVKGRINTGMAYLKEHFPDQQIILLTPIHRGYANFTGTNVQPEESFPNNLGIFFEEYVKIYREAASVWAVPLIDLYSVSGLYPVCDAHAKYFHDAETDRLHPNAAGHKRIADTLFYQLLALPSNFRE